MNCVTKRSINKALYCKPYILHQPFSLKCLTTFFRTHQTNKHGDRYDSLSEADELAEHGGRKLNGEDEDYRCLLDVISVTLSDMDLFTARRVWKSDYMKGDLSADMEFSTFVIEREVTCRMLAKGSA